MLSPTRESRESPLGKQRIRALYLGPRNLIRAEEEGVVNLNCRCVIMDERAHFPAKSHSTAVDHVNEQPTRPLGSCESTVSWLSFVHSCSRSKLYAIAGNIK